MTTLAALIFALGAAVSVYALLDAAARLRASDDTDAAGDGWLEDNL